MTKLTVHTRTVYTVTSRATLLATAQAPGRKLGGPRPRSEREALRTLPTNPPRGIQERPGDYGLHRGGTVLMATDDTIDPDQDIPEALLHLAGEGGALMTPVGPGDRAPVPPTNLGANPGPPDRGRPPPGDALPPHHTTEPAQQLRRRADLPPGDDHGHS